MAFVSINGSTMGNALNQLMGAGDIIPGDAPSYQMCKTIYAFHPLGAKIAEKPVSLAQSKKRIISVQKGPEARVKEEFEKKWKEMGCETSIFNLMALSRVYGVASVAILVEGKETNIPINYKELYKNTVSFNVFDPLNTAGSLVINQIPNALDFMKATGRITVNGTTYHPSRTVVMMNEQPLYIEYTTSGFGFVGRSVYQRALFPLKSFINSMKTDDMVVTKAGVIVAALKQAGSIIDGVMLKLFSIKREVVKQAETYNVISVGQDDKIETLNMQNLDGAYSLARKNILENIAAAADDMPAVLLNQETFAEGFGEGDNDAEMVKHYINRIREKMDPAYKFFDTIVQFMAWTPDFYKAIQSDFPEYKDVPYETAFYEWVNSFKTDWPPFTEEPPSEQVKVDDVKLKAVIALVQVLAPMVDPENRAAVIQWACDNFNSLKLLFSDSLNLDYDALLAYKPEPSASGLEEPSEPKPFAAADSVQHAVEQFSAAVISLTDRSKKNKGPQPPARR